MTVRISQEDRNHNLKLQGCKKNTNSWFSSNQMTLLLNAFYYFMWKLEVINVIFSAFIVKKKGSTDMKKANFPQLFDPQWQNYVNEDGFRQLA